MVEKPRGMASFRSGTVGRVGGFTIVELVGVLALVTLVSTVAIRAWFGRSDVTLQNAAELLASDLREMQTRATIRRSPVEVVFHADGGGYHAHDLGQADEQHGTRRYPTDAVFEDVHVGSVSVERGGTLVFDAIGRPASDASITLVSGGFARTVLVDAGTVRVTVEGER
jgi:Tfp pilus assembly protein FimT